MTEDEESGDNVISLDKIKNESGFGSQNGFKALNDDDDDDSNLSSKICPQIVAPTVDLQNPFQPCSTPVHLQRRFMVINIIFLRPLRPYYKFSVILYSLLPPSCLGFSVINYIPCKIPN